VGGGPPEREMYTLLQGAGRKYKKIPFLGKPGEDALPMVRQKTGASRGAKRGNGKNGRVSKHKGKKK